MNRLTYIILALLLSAGAFAQNVGINSDGSAPDASAMLDVKSTTKGFLPPRVTSTGDITSPATGLLVYQTGSTAGYYYYNGSSWIQIGSASSASQWTTSSNDIYFNSGNVGIGTISPSSLLQVGSAATSQIAPGIGTYGQFAMLASQQLLSFGLSDSEPWASWIQSSNPITSGALPLVLNPSGGNVGIGTTSPDAPLHVNGSVGINAGATYFNGGSSGLTTGTTNFNMSIHASNDIVANGSFVATSDKRVKENITELHHSLDMIGRLRPVSYNKINKVEQGSRLQYGFIAQEVEEVIPEAVNTGIGEVPVLKPFENVSFEDGVEYTILVKNGDDIKEMKYKTGDARPDGEIIVKSKTVNDFKSITYDMIFTVAVDAIQEQQLEIEQLKQKLLEKDQEFNVLKAEVENIKKMMTTQSSLAKIN